MLRSRGPSLLARVARMAPLAGSLLWLLIGNAPSSAAEPRHAAAIVRGEHIARIVCSACHVVAKDQEYPPILDMPGPTFYDVANRPGTTAKSLRHFIASTHWDMQTIPMTMPNPMLTPEDTRAVALYILSLRAR
jgi:mono/diheme cytochrome c family protein